MDSVEQIIADVEQMLVNVRRLLINIRVRRSFTNKCIYPFFNHLPSNRETICNKDFIGEGSLKRLDLSYFKEELQIDTNWNKPSNHPLGLNFYPKGK